MSNGRFFQLQRVFTILQRLEAAPQGLTVAELHERIRGEFEVNERTVYRDLEALERMGFAVFPDDRDRSDSGAARWKANRSIRVAKTLNLEYRELIGLYIARNMLIPLKDTPIYQDLERVFHKLETALGENALDCLNELKDEIRFDPGPRWGLGSKPEIIDTVQAAIAEKHILSVLYDSVHSGTRRERKIGPHFLYFAKGALYLVADDIETKATKVFCVPRIHEAKMSPEPYSGPTVDPEKFFETALSVFRGEQPEQVQIVVRQPMAAFVKERRWHSSQRIVARTDDSVELRLDVALTPELVNWILGLGAAAEVLAPRELRKQLRETANEIAAAYEE